MKEGGRGTDTILAFCNNKLRNSFSKFGNTVSSKSKKIIFKNGLLLISIILKTGKIPLISVLTWTIPLSPKLKTGYRSENQF